MITMGFGMHKSDILNIVGIGKRRTYTDSFGRMFYLGPKRKRIKLIWWTKTIVIPKHLVPKGTRWWNRKKYYKTRVTQSKAVAENYATKRRNEGYLARVIYDKRIKYWLVYTHKPKKIVEQIKDLFKPHRYRARWDAYRISKTYG